jgi:multidrug efflux pump subunit AcrA (membrane-fusion protein)
MKFNFTAIRYSLTVLILSSPTFAQDNFQSINLAGTVIAENESGLSYEAQGCITEVSQEAVNSGLAIKDQVLVRLDDRTSQLALKSAQARAGDLKAAVEESEFSITVAKADLSRSKEEFEFVLREFDRTNVLFKRGLVNETMLETAERKKLNATFSVERAEEALIRAHSRKSRADIANEIGQLEVQSRELDLEDLTMRAPFDGVLLNFEPNVGDCVSRGTLAAQIYAPEAKIVETFVFVDQLVIADSVGVVVNNPVNVIRVNGQICPGTFSGVETEANLENQNVKTTIDLNEACARSMFLNEAVEIETLPKAK